PADERPARTEDEEGDGGGPGDRPRTPAELRFHGLDVHAENRPQSRAGHHAEGDRAEDDPRRVGPPGRGHVVMMPAPRPGDSRRCGRQSATRAVTARLNVIVSPSASTTTVSPSTNSCSDRK